MSFCLVALIGCLSRYSRVDGLIIVREESSGFFERRGQANGFVLRFERERELHDDDG